MEDLNSPLKFIVRRWGGGRVTTFSELESQHSRFYLSWQVWTVTLLYQTVPWRLYQMYQMSHSSRDCFVLTCCHFVNMKGCQLRSWKLHHYLEVCCCLNWNKKTQKLTNKEQWRLQWKPCDTSFDIWASFSQSRTLYSPIMLENTFFYLVLSCFILSILLVKCLSDLAEYSTSG